MAASSHAISRNWTPSTKKCVIRWRNSHNEQAQFSLSPVGDCSFAFGNALVAWRARSSPRVPQAPVVAQPTRRLPSDIARPNIAEATPTGRQSTGGPRAFRSEMERSEAKRRIDPEYEWKMPINFYGRVVDENEQPVPSAISRTMDDFLKKRCSERNLPY